MKSMTKTILIFFVFLAAFVFAGNIENAKAASNKMVVSSSIEKKDWLVFTRVVEQNGESFIYVFTEGGVFITKYEEL
jgi:hypothetical protein